MTTDAREGYFDLDEMVADLDAGPLVFQPATFWRRLNSVHRSELETWGFENFKRTINTKYFNWRILGILRHQLRVFTDLARHPQRGVFAAQFPKPQFRPGSTRAAFNPPSAWLYKLFVASYAELVRRRDPLRLIDRLEEPMLGNPFAIVHRGRVISQDLCNSIHEFYSIFGADGGRLGAGQHVEVAELGAGYGRLAYVVLKATPNASYTIIDVPPALYISQRYLTSVLPELHAFRYRRWEQFEDVRAEYESARIRFLLPHQADQLPGKSFDVFVNISSLHEMSRDQVERYFRLMDHLTRGRVYTKQWRRSRADVNGVVFGEHDYPVPNHWRTLFHRQHPIQSMFFEALYEVT